MIRTKNYWSSCLLRKARHISCWHIYVCIKKVEQGSTLAAFMCFFVAQSIQIVRPATVHERRFCIALAHLPLISALNLFQSLNSLKENYEGTKKGLWPLILGRKRKLFMACFNKRPKKIKAASKRIDQIFFVCDCDEGLLLSQAKSVNYLGLHALMAVAAATLLQ